MRNFGPFIGETYGVLTVLSERLVQSEANGSRRLHCTCRCVCGKEVEVKAHNLRTGNTKSCGCLKRDGHAARTHGKSTTKEYFIWASMRQRCTNPKKESYKYYGARGITVCDRWQHFENFLADMGTCPDGLSIERKNNDLGYFPENCCWATAKEQSNNRRNVKKKKGGVPVIQHNETPPS